MGAQGNTTVNFGAFPGASDAAVDITGQSGIVAGSCVEAWIRCEDSADHSADEHFVETIDVKAVSIIAGTGFKIRVKNTNQINEPLMTMTDDNKRTGDVGPPILTPAGNRDPFVGGMGTRLYGVWNVSWVWN